MKCLIAPLNWGLGHATRCIPLIRQFIADGHEVVIGSDGEALEYLQNYFSDLRSIELPPLDIHYSAKATQVGVLVRQLPHIIKWMRCDRRAIATIQQTERFDLVISDNRFGLIAPNAVYITHQLHIILPHSWRWLEPLAEWWHRRIINRYAECWIPDDKSYPGLAGDLSHPKTMPRNAKYIGALSRFCKPYTYPATDGSTLAIISGPEPQRSLFEQEIVKQYKDAIIVNGKPPYISDKLLEEYILKAERIVSRSGYTSIMDYATLGVLNKVVMTPTPGQSEQEYLATLHK